MRRLFSRSVVTLAFTIAFASCASTEKPANVEPIASPSLSVSAPVAAVAPGAPVASASSSAHAVDASVTKSSVSLRDVAAWTDPDGIEFLARDCHADPPHSSSDEPNPLSCRVLYEQSCTYDPCYSKHGDCTEACGKTCDTCDAACTTSCDSCKTKCNGDAACEKSCATTTASCKQACLTPFDHCTSAGCADASKSCYTREKAAWKAHGCSCKVIQKCTEPCVQSEEMCDSQCKNSRDASCTSKCRESCFSKCKAKFPGCDTAYCIMGSEP